VTLTRLPSSIVSHRSPVVIMYTKFEVIYCLKLFILISENHSQNLQNWPGGLVIYGSLEVIENGTI